MSALVVVSGPVPKAAAQTTPPAGGGVLWWDTNPFDNAVSTGVPTPLPQLTGSIVQVSASYDVKLALQTDGTVWGWGGNNYGQAGQVPVPGSPPPLARPAKIAGLSGVTKLSADGRLSVALKSDGTVWAWGLNRFGFLGSSESTSVPVQIAGLSSVIDIQSIGESVYAVRSDGSLLVVGDSQTAPPSVSPLTVLTAVRSIGRSDYFGSVYVVKTDNTLWGWGRQLANSVLLPAGGQLQIPTQVAGVTNVKAVATEREHTLVLLNDGTLLTWGSNRFGQLGNGTTVDSAVPITVAGVTGVTAIDVSNTKSLAITTDGSAWGWGASTFASGGNISYQLSPVRVGTGAWRTLASDGIVTYGVRGTQVLGVTITRNISLQSKATGLCLRVLAAAPRASQGSCSEPSGVDMVEGEYGYFELNATDGRCITLDGTVFLSPFGARCDGKKMFSLRTLGGRIEIRNRENDKTTDDQFAHPEKVPANCLGTNGNLIASVQCRRNANKPYAVKFDEVLEAGWTTTAFDSLRQNNSLGDEVPSDPRIALIIWTRPDGGAAVSCTGAIAPGGVVMTAQHCVEKLNEVPGSRLFAAPGYYTVAGNAVLPYGLYELVVGEIERQQFGADRAFFKGLPVAISGLTGTSGVNPLTGFSITSSQTGNRLPLSSLPKFPVNFQDRSQRTDRPFNEVFGYPSNLKDRTQIARCAGTRENTYGFGIRVGVIPCEMSSGSSGGPVLENGDIVGNNSFERDLVQGLLSHHIVPDNYGKSARDLYESVLAKQVTGS